MELKFIKASPTENMTLLIETPVARENQLAVAERLIAYGGVYAEQAGYIEAAENPLAEKRLQMMAGEFCGNASLSLAAWLAKEKRLPIGEKTEITLEVSGAEALVSCELLREAENAFSGRVTMPLPSAIEERTFWLDGEGLELTAVVFAGITHIVIPVSLWGEAARQKAERAARAWAKELPAVFGLLLLDEREQRLQPLVAVGEVSLIWERGCGSGTAAVGAYLAAREKKDIFVSLKQPGGVMCAAVSFAQEKITKIELMGKVAIVAEGTAYL